MLAWFPDPAIVTRLDKTSVTMAPFLWPPLKGKCNRLLHPERLSINDITIVEEVSGFKKFDIR